MGRLLRAKFTAKILSAGLLALTLIACEQPVSDNPGESLIVPHFTGVTPASPSNSLTVTLTGTAAPATTARVYSDSLCEVAFGQAISDSNGNFSLVGTVQPDRVYEMYTLAVDHAGEISGCAYTGVTWVQDSTPPIVPISISVSGGTPQNNNSPVVTGQTEAFASISIHQDAACSTAAVSGSADGSGNFSITGSVTNDTTTTFYAKASDLAGNSSACSTANFVYVEDSIAPVTPSSISVTPASPAPNNSPHLLGSGEVASIARVYTNASCTSSVLTSSTIDGAGNFNITLSLASDSTNNLYVTSTDAAGNVSPCSAGVLYVEDSTAPALPNSLTVTGGINQNNNSPHVTGIAEASSTLNLYTNSSCTSALAGSTTTSGAGTWDIQVAVADNSATTYYARATDPAGNVGSCSTNSVTFTEDSIAPVIPTSVSVTGGTPQNNNLPHVTGQTEANAYVRVYTDSACTGGALGNAYANGAGNFDVLVFLPDNVTRTFYAISNDTAGNLSPCSVSNFVYVEDSTAPAVPTGLGTSPISPANNNSPHITGTTEAAATVRIYANSSCTGGILATGTANGGGSFDITLSVANDSFAFMYATATDAVGNVSACSTSFAIYSEDSTAPPRPTTISTTPTSPANNNSPTVGGAAEFGATINIYTNSSCTSAIAGTGTAAGGNYSIAVSVTNDTSTTFYAKATDFAGNVGLCSLVNVTYVEDSISPVIPTSLSVTSGTPQNNNIPHVTGATEANAYVRVYTDSLCTGGALGNAYANGAGNFDIIAFIPDNVTRTFYALANDAAGNLSPCSVSNFTYVEDSTAPAVPTGLATSPVSPANNNSPHITGATEAAAIVRIYANSSCTGGILATGTANGSGNFDITLSVANDSFAFMYATATDAVGNLSACSTSFAIYSEDSTAPPRPTSITVTPTSPANNNSPTISGAAEFGATVNIYTDSSCSSAIAGTGTAAGGNYSIAVSVTDDTSTTFYAKATDFAGNAGLCSLVSVNYVEDSTAPNAPSVTAATSPTSPNPSNTPNISGTAEANSVVSLYTNNTCTSAVLATGSASGGGSWTIQVSVSDNSSSTIYAKAVDASSNSSTCSATSATYVNDKIAPAVPSTLTLASPSSPSNNNSPTIAGSTEANAFVYLYTNSNCTSAVAGSASANGAGSFSVVAGVSDDTTSNFYAKSVDAAGNASTCSTDTTSYTEDSTSPSLPTGLATNPVSPANDNSPLVTGSAEAGSTVSIYTNSICTSAVAGSGPATGGSFSISVSVSDDSSTSFYAKAVDASGNSSGCSTATVSFSEDSTAPIAPSITAATSPVSPNPSNTPDVSGTAEANSVVKLYSNNTCTSGIIGTGTTSAGGSWTVQATVSDNTSTTIYAKATDGVANTSTCSLTSTTYVNDKVAPSIPASLSVVAPANPSNNNTPTIGGLTEANAFVYLYTNSNCTSAVAGSGSANGAGSFSVVAGVSDDTTSNFYARSVDAAGNASSCSTDTTAYTEDSTPPAVPTLVSTSPSSPSDSHDPNVIGTADNNVVIKLYSNNTCTVLLKTGASDGSGNFSVAPTFTDDQTLTIYATAVDLSGNASSCSATSVTYSNYSVAEGVGYFTGTRSVAGTNLNQAASPFMWSSHKFHSTYYAHSTTTNSERVTVKVAGDYLIHLTMQIQTDQTTPNAESFQIRLGDGTTQVPDARGVCVASMGNVAGNSTNKTSTCNLTARLSFTANQVVDVTATGIRGSGTTWSNGSSMFIEYIDPAKDTFHGYATQNTNGTSDLNSNATEYYLKWNDIQKTAIYTHHDGSNPEEFQLTQAGTYFVAVDVSLVASTNSSNQRFKVYGGAAGSTAISGAEFKQGQSGGGTSGFESSAHWSGFLVNAAANDILRVSHQREGNTVGTQNLGASSLYLEKVNTTDTYFGRGTTVTGASSTNYNQDASSLNFTSDDIIDTGAFTHNTSSNEHQITINDPGFYKVTFSTSLTSATADVSPKFNLQVDGVNYGNAGTASTEIENLASQSEASGSFVYYVQTTSANQVVSVVTAVQHGVSGTCTADNDHTLSIRKISKSSTP